MQRVLISIYFVALSMAIRGVANEWKLTKNYMLALYSFFICD